MYYAINLQTVCFTLLQSDYFKSNQVTEHLSGPQSSEFKPRRIKQALIHNVVRKILGPPLRKTLKITKIKLECYETLLYEKKMLFYGRNVVRL